MTQEMPGDKVPLSATPISSVIAALMDAELLPRIRDIFAEHQVEYQERGDHWNMKFPDGSTKAELWPRVNRARYEITLPDGYKLYAVVFDSGWYGLRFQSKEFPNRAETW